MAEDAPDDVVGWFLERGFTTTLSDEDGVWWVALGSQPSGKTVAPRFGRGESQADALTSAWRRWRVEQDGV
jgi:hypothetical protein